MGNRPIIFAATLLSAIGILSQRANADTCTFNNERPMNCTVSSSNDSGNFQITITWEDGVSDTYTNVASNADKVNYLDSRGGCWHHYDHRNCRDSDFMNVDNGNIIRMVGDDAACR